MKSKKILAFFLFALGLSISACKKESARPTEPTQPTQPTTPTQPVDSAHETAVYAAGYKRAADGKRLAVVWKNGVEQILAIGTNQTEAFCMYVSGSDVYVGGYDLDVADDEIKATIWKNGQPIHLTDGKNSAFVNGIFVSGSDVYAVGYQTNSNNIDVATIWKNGKATSLTKGLTEAYANSVYVVGSDVYVAGTEDSNTGKMQATYWKNGVPTVLPTESYSIAESIYVVGNDVYVAGSGYGLSSAGEGAKLWKNGVVQNLFSEHTRASSYGVFVSADNTVYVAGYTQSQTIIGLQIAKIWKNGNAMDLSVGTANPNISSAKATHTYVVGSDVYAAGRITIQGKDVATVWKNGQPTYLTDGKTDAEAVAIIVK